MNKNNLIPRILSFKHCFINFIINRFAPDYEKIKTENKELKQDIYNLIAKENEIDGITTKTRWEFKFKKENAMMFSTLRTDVWGRTSFKKDSKANGILSQITDI